MAVLENNLETWKVNCTCTILFRILLIGVHPIEVEIYAYINNLNVSQLMNR